MEISSYDKAGQKVVAITGRIDAVTATELSSWVESEVTPPTANIIMDCTGVDYVSSAGLRVILQLTKLAKQHEYIFSLCNPQDNLKEVLDISGFSSLFPVHGSLEDALNNDD
ncbi:MAG: anti-sigma factor antagonist [Desulfobulbaceae bacterium]|nr:MAG: anti-sigma factor antagonist [Desulfobulbaceae bacterium]